MLYNNVFLIFSVLYGENTIASIAMKNNIHVYQYYVFLFFHGNIYCGYSLEASREALVMNSHNMFSWRNQKKNLLLGIERHICVLM